MQKESSRRLSFECSSTCTKVHFSQRWHIADFKCLAELSDPGARYDSCPFSHPCVKNMVWYVRLDPIGQELTENGYPALFLCSRRLTNAQVPVTASYQLASIADDGKGTVVNSCHLCKYDGSENGWGRNKLAINVCREDGSLVLDCRITALVHLDQAGISGALYSAKALAHPNPNFACILSNVASTCQEWYISDVKRYISTSQPGDKIEGHEFAHPSVVGACWNLRFFPNGKDNETKGNKFLYLHLNPVSGLNIKVKARFQFFAISENGKQKAITDVLVREFQSNDHDKRSFGIDKWSSADFLRKDGSLLLKCDISTLICDPTRARSISVPPKLLVPGDQEKNVHQDLFDCMAKMVDSGYASDFVIKVGPAQFPVHRGILGCRSKVFKTMLDSCSKKVNSAESRIPGFSAEAVKSMIRFIYVGTVPDGELGPHMKELVGLAEKYKLQDLKDLCEHKICKDLVPDNVIDSMILANTYNLPLVKDACLNLFLPLMKDQFVQSGAWVKLKADQPKLAIEILEKVGFGAEVYPPDPKRSRSK